MSVLEQDRFFPSFSGREIVWMYHNPDAVSGDQFVVNVFDLEQLETALVEETSSAAGVFGRIEVDCLQYCVDPDNCIYGDVKQKFSEEPLSIGCNAETLDKILCYYERLPQGSLLV